MKDALPTEQQRRGFDVLIKTRWSIVNYIEEAKIKKKRQGLAELKKFLLTLEKND